MPTARKAAAVSLTNSEVAGRVAASPSVIVRAPAATWRDHGRDDGPHRLARPEGVERAQCDHRDAEARVVGCRPACRRHLRRGVRRLGLQRVGPRRSGRSAPCRTSRWSRCAPAAACPVLAHGLQHVERADRRWCRRRSAAPGRSTGSRSARPGGRRPRRPRTRSFTDAASRTSPSTTSTSASTSAGSVSSQPQESKELYGHHGAHPVPVATSRLHEVRADEALRTGHRDDLGH